MLYRFWVRDIGVLPVALRLCPDALVKGADIRCLGLSGAQKQTFSD